MVGFMFSDGHNCADGYLFYFLNAEDNSRTGLFESLRRAAAQIQPAKFPLSLASSLMLHNIKAIFYYFIVFSC
jgi:hypothetical protein